MSSNFNPSATTYMRSVNDYSLSSHEIYNNLTGIKHPTHTLVHTEKSIEGTGFENAVDILVDSFRQDGYVVTDTYNIFYNDGTEPLEQSPYTIYEQLFKVLRRKVDGIVSKRAEDIIVLEMYRRGTEFIALTLGVEDTREIINRASKIFKDNYVAPIKDKTFYTISQSSHGFELDEMKITTEYDESFITEHYNDDFLPVHNTIIDTIDTNKKGIILLHGLPGSGKTSYIKQLISRGGNRKIVYIPPHLAGSIAAPAFISFVKESLTNSVLVIEDAEDILRDRAGSADSAAVSNLLNLSDGIIGESVNLNIIATFNVEKEFIDKALMRKGRMTAEYYFGELARDKAQALTEKVFGEDAVLNLEGDEPCTLANIFNQNIVQHRSKGQAKVKTFGFTAK